MLLALAHVEEIVRLLRGLASQSGHEPSRDCCVVHRLLDALAWRAKNRRRFHEWRQDEEYRDDPERPRPNDLREALGLPPKVRTPKVLSGRVEVTREPVHARKSKKGGAT